MNFRKRLTLLALLLVGINLLTYEVLSHNLRTGIYPPDADAISIPAFSTLMASLLGGLFAFAAMSIVFVQRIVAYAGKSKKSRALVILLLVGLDLPPLVFLVAGAGYWLYPHHYLISVGLGIVFVILALSLVLDVRLLRRGHPHAGSKE